MSKLIFCNGTVAEVPFYFKLTDINIYSIEELCYYIYNNIYSIDESELDGIARWLKEELKMTEISEGLQKLVQNQVKLKEIVIFLLGSISYYTEEDLDFLLKVINEIEKYPEVYRQKLKGDNFLKYKNYSNAIMEYEDIIQNTKKEENNPSFLGDIWHNMGVVYARMMDYINAGHCFINAYKLNDNIKSLKQYLYTLNLSKTNNFNIAEELIEDLQEEVKRDIREIYEQAESEEEYLYIMKAITAKEKGQVAEYYRRIDKIISTWKKEYREQTLK